MINLEGFHVIDKDPEISPQLFPAWKVAPYFARGDRISV